MKTNQKILSDKYYPEHTDFNLAEANFIEVEHFLVGMRTAKKITLNDVPTPLSDQYQDAWDAGYKLGTKQRKIQQMKDLLLGTT